MNLSLSEAAHLLGKSDRQIRYWIKKGSLPAKKSAGRWFIRREDLPLSEGQKRAATRKVERAADLAEEILRTGSKSPKKTFSVREIRAYREGAPIFHQVVEATSPAHPSVDLLKEAFMQLACGYHEFEGESKARHYAVARQHASRAAMVLLLEDEEKFGKLAQLLESILLPAIGGLIHQAEKRGNPRRTKHRK